jgi:DNA (cytosine-5)-methyltransferase 1
MIKFIDLFAGIGGFRLALENNGAECVFSSEIDKSAQKVYLANFKGNIHGDITKIDEKSIPSHDVLCAGFPCQAFSSIGSQAGFADSRGQLFFEIVRIVSHHKPKILFLENVKGLLSNDGGKTFATIKDNIYKLGYTLNYKVLSSTMFDLPQKRNRVYMVAVRNDIENTFEFPEGSLTSRRLKDIIESNVDAKYFLNETRNNVICLNRKLKRGGYGFHIIGQNDFVHTLLASKYEFNLVVDNTIPINLSSRKDQINKDNIRRLTPKEYARLQGYSDSFYMPVTNKQAYRLFGNSVSVPVIDKIFEKIKLVIS